MDYALSDADINKILEPDTTVRPYRVLDTLDHIDQLFDRIGRAVLLYNTTDKYTGHWVGLIKRAGVVEFFDPYGFQPDTQQYKLGKGIDNILFEQHDHDLTRLLKESKYRVYYNTYPFQDFTRSEIATCGRWVALRLYYYKKTLRQFKNMIPTGMNMDEWVTEQTDRLL